MNMMGYRYQCLQHTLEALNLSNVPLVQTPINKTLWWDKAPLVPSGFTDDLGIYYFIPLLSKNLHISLDGAINLFLGMLIIGATFLGLVGYYFALQTWAARVLAIVGLVILAFYTWRIGDVYVIQMFAVVSLIPIFLAFYKQKDKGFWLVGAFAFARLVCGYSNCIRSQSGTGILLFLILLLGFASTYSNKEKIIFLVMLLAFFSIPVLHFKSLENQRDAVLVKVIPDYHPATIKHTFWHSVFIGLGYVNNQHGINYDDSSGDEKAKSIDPKVRFQSQEYQEILKNQVLILIKTDPLLIVRNLLAKSFRLLINFVLFFNLGLIFLFRVKLPWNLTLPFVVLIVWSALPGLLVVPSRSYILGFTASVDIFGLYLIGLGIEEYFLDRRRP